MTRQKASLLARFESKYIPEPNTGCWLWTHSVGGWGYGQIMRSSGKPASAHRISWLIHRGEIPKGMWVLHRCDVRICVNPEHLFLGTHQDNDRDREQKGRGRNGGNLGITIGEKHGGAKLTESQVLEIRRRYRPGRGRIRGNGASLAVEYGVNQFHLVRVAKGKSWRHLNEPGFGSV